jgi:hypothetical protein
MDAMIQLRVRRWRPLRTVLIALLGFVLIAWGLTDIRNRGRWNPAIPLNHMTDLTVYTEAGAAFFDGRDPYTVANHRGWHYLYPPLLAIVLAPLSKLDSQWQALIWYFINLVIAWGCCYESWRLLRCLIPHQFFRPRVKKIEQESVESRKWKDTVPLSPGERGGDGEGANSTTLSNPQSFASAHSPAPRWLVACAAGAMLLPTLNCLQRGQVGLLIAYFVLLGLRLVVASRSWLGWAAGGMALALAITVKLTPLMPALFLLAMLALPSVMRWQKSALAKTLSLSAGLIGGLALFLFFLPAAAVGWSANLQHLHRFVDLIVVNHDMGGENDLTYHSVRNQSLVNAAYRLGNWVALEAGHGPDDLADKPDSSMPMDAEIVHRGLSAIRLGLLGLLAAVGWRAARRGTALDLAAAYGAACVATLLVSPLSWAHHYIIEAPGVLLVPLWFWQRGAQRAATMLAVSACGLMWAHYLLLDVAGRAGLLGLGTTVWFIAAAVGMLRDHSAAAAVASDETDAAADFASAPADRFVA